VPRRADDAEARDAFEQARYVADNGPDDTPGADPIIVSNCWLYRTAETDPSAARDIALSGDAELIATYME